MTLKITMTRSCIGQKDKIKKVARSLGLKRPNQFVLRKDTPHIRGMIKKLYFMVKVEEVE
ncbi:MAG: 50S ribosomal protein L30 [Desulfurella sp.]|jgi:large subunit ribosomal protein L30|uniref:50S ribosomal protein L30 n=1 Tax=Desulfurella multipotens TaxID=79269 RepID=A0A1G6KI12_9BACT|nr:MULTISPECIES: 50S ribosomal protein L30 [Desulfurella]AHF96705.1 50S ribosomal protein L30 [Desulfurella acetivorans A63]SDC30604.1 large subunit ribosomal protein L30 [Desulfurella multipotens]